ncbi:MAG TPA: hypothetical protein ENK06_07360 [Gammaproteobacteria bacterium]|nr:hypothetical protein [Gammaproteobacteria bacterium]
MQVLFQKKITNKNVLSMLLSAVCLITTSFSAYGEKLPKTSEDSLFVKMDINKNGLIEPSEIYKKSLLATEFDNVDKNQDGSLDQREFEVFILLANI